MTFARGIAIVVGLFFLVMAPAAQAAQSSTGSGAVPVERITGLPLPLLDGEHMVRLADGCHRVASSALLDGAKAVNARLRWYGACRFGLIDGPGFLRSEGVGSSAVPFAWTAKMGRDVREPGGPEVFARTVGRPAEWRFQIFSTPDEARAWANSRVPNLPESISGDLSWSARIVSVSRSAGSDGRAEKLDIDIEHKPCLKGGPDNSIEQSFVKFLAMSPANAKSLTPYCAAALARLKRERPDLASEWEWEPYKELAWGYYHLVRVRRSNGQVADTATEETFICPQPGNGTSCHAVWGPIVAPYVVIRDAERKREVESERTRDVMIQALETAFADKLKTHAAKIASRGTK